MTRSQMGFARRARPEVLVSLMSYAANTESKEAVYFVS